MFKNIIANALTVAVFAVASVVGIMMIIFPFVAFAITFLVLGVVGGVGWIYMTVLGPDVSPEELENRSNNFIDLD